MKELPTVATPKRLLANTTFGLLPWLFEVQLYLLRQDMIMLCVNH